MTWNAYDGRSLLVRQSKGVAAVRIPVAAHLKAMLDATKRRSPFIVTTQRAKRGSCGAIHSPYSGDGFRSSFADAVAEAGIVGRTFHDFRGTFTTRAQEAGATRLRCPPSPGMGRAAMSCL
jgi:integrase